MSVSLQSGLAHSSVPQPSVVWQQLKTHQRDAQLCLVTCSFIPQCLVEKLLKMLRCLSWNRGGLTLTCHRCLFYLQQKPKNVTRSSVLDWNTGAVSQANLVLIVFLDSGGLQYIQINFPRLQTDGQCGSFKVIVTVPFSLYENWRGRKQEVVFLYQRRRNQKRSGVTVIRSSFKS